MARSTPARDDRVLARVPLAWPTLILAAAALALWGAAAALVAAGHLLAGVLLASAAVYLAFTPMHDAAHQALGRSKALNAVVGRLCALVFAAPFPAFRYVHLEHHKHTNDPARDPDHYSGRGPRWQLPLRWLTQDLHYYAHYLGAARSRREQVEVWGSVALVAALAIALVALGHGRFVLFAWLLPARLGLALLAFSFDYLPHRPHVVLGREDRFRATSMRPTPWLTPLLLCQNHHLIHHLYPAVPFYRYPAVWRAKEAELRARGAWIIEPGKPRVPATAAESAAS